jgi:nucleoside-diphosphate-sugar epimerase
MRVLVTGCCGYLGSVLVSHLLAAGQEVIGVDSLLYGPGPLLAWLGNPLFTFHREDIRRLRREVVGEVDAVVHLAALVGEPVCKKCPGQAWAINAAATHRLVGLLQPGQRFLYPNTNSGYGTTDGQEECDERTPLAPLSDYARSKCEGERAVLCHDNVVSVRLATVFGPSPRMRLDLMVNHFTTVLARERVLHLFEPHFLRNFIHVGDVARVFGHFLHHSHLRGVYNAGLPQANLTKLELAHTVCDILGLPHSAVLIGQGQDPDQRNYRVSNERLLATGFFFQHTLEEGIKQVAQLGTLFEPVALEAMRNA